MKTMTIDGVEYAEAPETAMCDGCAFARESCCNSDESHIAQAGIVFGGFCGDRQVIYIRADKAREKALTKLTETSQELGVYDEKRYTKDELDAAVAADTELLRRALHTLVWETGSDGLFAAKTAEVLKALRARLGA